MWATANLLEQDEDGVAFFNKKKPILKLNLPPLEQKSEQDQDRRYLPRWKISNKVLYRRAKEVFYREARSRDISATGLCLSALDLIAVNERLNISIYLAQERDPILVRGKAVWRKLHGSENMIGIQFDSVDNKTSELIFKYAFEFKRDEVMKRWFKGA